MLFLGLSVTSASEFCSSPHRNYNFLVQLSSFEVNKYCCVYFYKGFMKNQSKNIKKYAIFFFTGIFTFYLSGYILRGIHPPRSIYLMFLIYLILFATELLVLRDYSPSFALKGFAISFGALFLISADFFALGAYNHINSAEYWIETEKLDIVPEKYAVVTESEIEEHPALSRALKTAGEGFTVDSAEWKQVEEFLNLKGSNVIKRGNDYYQVQLSVSVA